MAQTRKRFYTRPKQVKLAPGQKLRFTEGRGYWGGAPGAAPPLPAVKKTTTTTRSGNVVGKGTDWGNLISSYFGGGGALLSPEEIRKRARQQVDDAMAEQGKAFEKERARILNQNQNDQLTQMTWALGLGAMRGERAGEINDAWRNAAGSMQSFANALGTDVAGTQQAAITGAEGAVQAAGAPGEVTAPAPGNNAAVASFVHGTLPGEEWGAKAGAMYDQALARGDAVGARYWDNMIGLGYAGKQAQAELAGKKMELEAQRPKLIREAEAALRGEARQDIATLISALAMQNTFDMTKLTKTTKKAAAKTDAQKAKDAANAAKGFLPDGKTPLPTHYINPATGKPSPIPSGFVADPSSATGLRELKPGEKDPNKPKEKKPATIEQKKQTRQDMLEDGRRTLKLDQPFAKNRPNWSWGQIRKYLMSAYGNDYIKVFGEKAWVVQLVKDTATRLRAEVLASQKRK